MKNEGFSPLARFIITGVFLVVALHFLHDLLIPLLYGAFLAMLFLPMVSFLEKKKIPRTLSIGICLLAMVVSVIIISLVLYSELAKLSKDLPLFEKKALDLFSQLQVLFEKLSRVSVSDQTEWIKNNSSKVLTEGSGFVRNLLLTISHGTEMFVFVVIYFFCFLLLRERFTIFFYKLFEKEHHTGVETVIDKTQVITRKYMGGQLKVMAIIGALNAIGFLIIGVKQAFFWGFIRGLLNIIPYIGPVLGAIFPALSALTFEDSIGYPIAVIGVVAITQVLQDNFLMPRLIGSNIKLNPLSTIMAILIGGMLWGVNGMILFLPMVGIIKVICDNVESLKPYGYLLGDDE